MTYNNIFYVKERSGQELSLVAVTLSLNAHLFVSGWTGFERRRGSHLLNKRVRFGFAFVFPRR